MGTAVVPVPVAELWCVCQVGYIDDRFGPLGLAVVVVLALSAIFVISITDFILQLRVPHNTAG